MYQGNRLAWNAASMGTVKMSSPSKKTKAVNSEARDASKMGTNDEAVRSIMMTSTAKTMAATGALNMAAKDPAAAQPINKRRRRKCRRVCEATSEPMAAPACTAGASKPPEPPNPTDKMLVTTGANIQVRFMRPRLVEMACNVEGMPGPGWSLWRSLRTTVAVATNPKMGPNARNQEPPNQPWMANIPARRPATDCFIRTANSPDAMPTTTAQSMSPWSDFIQSHARWPASLALMAPERSPPTRRRPVPLRHARHQTSNANAAHARPKARTPFQ